MNVLDIELIEVHAGEFQMGSDAAFWGETPSHPVTIPGDFLLGKYPVTQQQWFEVMKSKPSHFKGNPKRPVDSVSWLDARSFCERLADLSGEKVRLPTEAEWEYACRAGTDQDFFFTLEGRYLEETQIPPAHARTLCDFAWCELNSMEETKSVGLKRPNPFGLYDMVGMLWEWCEDDWHEDYSGAPVDGSAWIDESGAHETKVLRGGAWDMGPFRCRSSYRSYDGVRLGTSRFGLRVLVEI